MRWSFITRMPDSPGALERAAEIIKENSGNIERIHYDREIDSYTVFFEVTSEKEAYPLIMEGLEKIGYLQTDIKPVRVLKFNIYLPNEPGALLDFLDHTSKNKANIAFLDFDENGRHPDRLTVKLTIENSSEIDSFLEELKDKYRIDILDYDPTGCELDDTVFYVRLAENLRGILGDKEEDFILRLLQDSNHIAQELSSIGQDPKKAFSDIIATGRRLKETHEEFYCEVESFKAGDERIYCFQPPCGGNVYVIESKDGLFLIDSGFGIYHSNFESAMRRYGLDPGRIKKIYLTHADADHVGGAGLFGAKAVMHPKSTSIIEETNRAYGSDVSDHVLTGVYTGFINLFSNFSAPKDYEFFSTEKKGMEGIFPVIDSFRIGSLEFSVLEGFGGHLLDQVFFYCEDPPLLFPGDSLINFESLSDDRREYNLLAKNLMTTVNADSKKAKVEREGLIEIAKKHKDTIICCGHGSVSKYDQKLVSCISSEHYVENE